MSVLIIAMIGLLIASLGYIDNQWGLFGRNRRTARTGFTADQPSR